eukprot:NODE_19369_length_273_cov_4.410714_g18201_i0.p4 GENE.NODE_19369_length_273_cov_4.410714_g18201_i0~~NODE_19369_length_273_cov_4.410714_g18201_i0.p4  ORF type:complete len:53 (+),score=0.32 NODE_19369_length_273_cov_4.410714_g18201_i0:3-161(+)
MIQWRPKGQRLGFRRSALASQGSRRPPPPSLTNQAATGYAHAGSKLAPAGPG